MKITLFEIEDERGKFVTSFDSPKAVEEFFLYLPRDKKSDDFTVLGFDSSGYLIQTWFASEVEMGNFIRDVEDYEKRNSKKPFQEKRRRR